MHKRMIAFVILTLLSISLFLSSCVNATPVGETQSVTEAARNDENALEQMKRFIGDNQLRINSFILIVDGETVEEAYFNGTISDTAAPVYSCTKSVISALVGIAIDEGSIPGVDEKISGLLGRDDISFEGGKADITIKDMLTMSSGLEPLITDEFLNEEDAVEYILKQQMVCEPGEAFEYTSGAPHIVSAILQRATGMETSDYAQEKLFGPLGFSKPEWTKDASGLAMGSTGLYLTPMQLADIGCLYLNGGRWNGRQVIPKDWIDESTSRMTDAVMTNESEQYGYGYYWWMNGFSGYSAHGYFGQYVFVLPDYSAVVVFTSQLNEADFSVPYSLMESYVLPSLESSARISAPGRCTTRTDTAFFNQ